MEDILNKLAHSKFRGGFHLNNKMKAYVNDKGLETIKKHAYDFINTRIRPAVIKNDGKQTPMKQVHPVFIAQHATATCCRNCIYKWHKFDKNKVLNDGEVDYLVNLIMAWIRKEMKGK